MSLLPSESNKDRLHGCGERGIDVQERGVGEVFRVSKRPGTQGF